MSAKELGLKKTNRVLVTLKHGPRRIYADSKMNTFVRVNGKYISVVENFNQFNARYETLPFNRKVKPSEDTK